GLVDLAREVLEEALKLVEVAFRGRQKARGVGFGGARRGDRRDVDLQLVAKARRAPAHAHQLAALEAPREHVRLAKRTRRNRPAAVAQLEREVRSAGARSQPFLAR